MRKVSKKGSGMQLRPIGASDGRPAELTPTILDRNPAALHFTMLDEFDEPEEQLRVPNKPE